MNILPKLTDGLNHPMVYGWWFMFSTGVEHSLSDGLKHPSMVDGLWLIVCG
jgi:hypothetical protein